MIKSNKQEIIREIIITTYKDNYLDLNSLLNIFNIGKKTK